jgi:hypothetical protein
MEAERGSREGSSEGDAGDPVDRRPNTMSSCAHPGRGEGAASGWLAEALDHPLDGMSQPVTIAASEMPGSFQLGRPCSEIDGVLDTL